MQTEVTGEYGGDLGNLSRMQIDIIESLNVCFASVEYNWNSWRSHDVFDEPQSGMQILFFESLKLVLL